MVGLIKLYPIYTLYTYKESTKSNSQSIKFTSSLLIFIRKTSTDKEATITKIGLYINKPKRIFRVFRSSDEVFHSFKLIVIIHKYFGIKVHLNMKKKMKYRFQWLHTHAYVQKYAKDNYTKV